MWQFILNIVFRDFEIFNEVWEKLLRVFASDLICSLFTKIVFSLNIFYPLAEVWKCAKTLCYRWYPFHLVLQNVHFSLLSVVIKQNFLYLGYVNDLISSFFKISVLEMFFAWWLLITAYSWKVYYPRVNIYIFFLVHGG